jgi:hypothetical protein
MRIDKKLEAELEKTGLDWAVEEGGIHQKIKLNGKLVAIFPRGKVSTSSKRALLNTIGQVRRAAKAMREIEGAATAERGVT